MEGRSQEKKNETIYLHVAMFYVGIRRQQWQSLEVKMCLCRNLFSGILKKMQCLFD